MSNLTKLSREDFQEDVANVLLLLLNQSWFIFFKEENYDDYKKDIAKLLNSNLNTEFNSPDLNARDLGLKFADISELAFSQTMMAAYDAAMLAEYDLREFNLEDIEEYPAMCYRIIKDLAKSEFLADRDDYTGYTLGARVERCRSIFDLACARLILDGSKEFGGLPDQYISFHQLSLLSGMTEASLRTIASRKENMLTSSKVAIGNGKTSHSLIHIDVARNWLKSKKIYTPIRYVKYSGRSILTDKNFFDEFEFITSIRARLDYLSGELGEEFMMERFEKIGIQIDMNSYQKFPDEFLVTENLRNAQKMEELGSALDLDPKIFSLKAIEASLNEKKRKVEREMKSIRETLNQLQPK